MRLEVDLMGKDCPLRVTTSIARNRFTQLVRHLAAHSGERAQCCAHHIIHKEHSEDVVLRGIISK